MEPIQSSEIFGNAKLGTGEPPKHTVDGHEKCVYYPGDLGGMFCQHGMDADPRSGFYSEDYVRHLIIVCQQVYTAVAAGNHRLTNSERKFFAEMRELTK